MDILHGIDLERVSRFEPLLEKSSFMEGVYTERERALISSSPRPARTAASSFAAKEAVSKALGRGLYGMLPREIEILRDDAGQPTVAFLGVAAARYGGCTVSLSISYKDDYALASCVICRA